MSISLNLQQALAPVEAEHVPQRRSFIKRAGTSLLALGSLALADGGPAAQTGSTSPARSTPRSAAGRRASLGDSCAQRLTYRVRVRSRCAHWLFAAERRSLAS